MKVAFSWVAAIVCLLTWSFGFFGWWGLILAPVCVLAPYLLILISTLLTFVGFTSKRK